ncbi:unnamed protein product [Phytophthora lilii]|uniref:Unnamed protein product n=1 Tax=Phytophthora lilii TaxID=2077276 RepID=A0A9W6TCE4_9STRA|nr:unnamed protein product [Phytophthora lilii]
MGRTSAGICATTSSLKKGKLQLARVMVSGTGPVFRTGPRWCNIERVAPRSPQQRAAPLDADSTRPQGSQGAKQEEAGDDGEARGERQHEQDHPRGGGPLRGRGAAAVAQAEGAAPVQAVAQDAGLVGHRPPPLERGGHQDPRRVRRQQQAGPRIWVRLAPKVPTSGI